MIESPRRCSPELPRVFTLCQPLLDHGLGFPADLADRKSVPASGLLLGMPAICGAERITLTMFQEITGHVSAGSLRGRMPGAGGLPG